MNDVAKVIHLHDVGDEVRPRQARRWPERGAAPGQVTSLVERLAATEPPAPQSLSDLLRGAVAKRIGKSADFARRRITGDYQVDEFGFDEHLLESVILPALRPMSELWFRVEASGVEHLPEAGGALIVANHAGTIPLDGLMLQLAVHDRHPKQRALRLLAADLIFETPVLGALARKAGHTLACREDAERLLRSGELTGVFPEGFKGVGKQYADRYKLQRFGRGGFVAAAVRTGAPIIPCSIVGSEEIYPKLADLQPLARLLGLPYFPVTPLFPLLGPLGALPLPSKWYIEFGAPIPTTGYEPEAADDPMTMFEVTDQVRETIQSTLYKLLTKRRNPFTG
ncbi:1-acyl-sn-glycerol-3-phosphate acyltransferase [Nocardia tenerifensis]|uniref:1-acyl-sn-glycerol-3-phosphate acyltransferase n=1 Tax=Nocardia tenerifensis TaxID=228006 RepID=A0A318K0G3_9NOCA|nr:lysophospholipid acyltransferase family protein [Nocardia tenerifensis]PXX65024.1 1-acyl-sn-glycerol-3-phosphate acyltransferase [Nocardia tenerifensis]